MDHALLLKHRINHGARTTLVRMVLPRSPDPLTCGTATGSELWVPKVAPPRHRGPCWRRVSHEHKPDGAVLEVALLYVILSYSLLCILVYSTCYILHDIL